MPPEKQTKLGRFFLGFEEKLKVEEKESPPKRQKTDEVSYKAARDNEGLPYVPNGSRDKFGNMRKRV